MINEDLVERARSAEVEYHSMEDYILTPEEFREYCKIKEYAYFYLSEYNARIEYEYADFLYLSMELHYHCKQFAKTFLSDGRFQSFIIGKFFVIDNMDKDKHWNIKKREEEIDKIIDEVRQEWHLTAAGCMPIKRGDYL